MGWKMIVKSTFRQLKTNQRGIFEKGRISIVYIGPAGRSGARKSCLPPFGGKQERDGGKRCAVPVPCRNGRAFFWNPRFAAPYRCHTARGSQLRGHSFHHHIGPKPVKGASRPMPHSMRFTASGTQFPSLHRAKAGEGRFAPAPRTGRIESSGKPPLFGRFPEGIRTSRAGPLASLRFAAWVPFRPAASRPLVPR